MVAGWWSGYFPPCNRITQANDPLDGGLALEITTPGGGNPWSLNTGAYTVPANATNTPNANTNFPDAIYVEAQYRDDQWPDGPGLGFWSDGGTDYSSCEDPSVGFNQAYIELDFLETGYDGGPSTGDDAAYVGGDGENGCPSSNGPVWYGDGSIDLLDYITIGYIVTNDGNNDYAICQYLNGTRQNCGTFSAPAGYDEERRILMLTNDLTNVAQADHTWIKYIKVWSCSTWLSSDPASWACSGTSGFSGTVYTGAANGGDTTNGACGSASTVYTNTAPTTNLCAAGTPSAVEGNGPWSWDCYGIGADSTDALCQTSSAPVNGVCGPANGVPASTAPAQSSLCSAGTPVTVNNPGEPWTWSCMGRNNTIPLGNTVSCSAPNTSVGACGSAQGVPTTTAPTSYLCSAGTASSVSSSGTTWTWSCTGTVSSVSCSAPMSPTSGGLCGAANGTFVNNAPTANLCAAGATASTVTDTSGNGSGPWTWSCTNGTRTSSCEAYLPGSGVACDIGPNYGGSIPAPAAAAGYTHCAANYDFTQPFFSSVSSWLQCPDNGSTMANNGSSLALWYLTNASSNPAPCSDINIINDGGTQVLDVAFTPSDFNNLVSFTQLTTQSGLNYPTPNGTGYPNGMYIELVHRMPQSSFNSIQPDVSNGGGVLVGGPFMNSAENASSGKDYMEWDFDEMYGQSTSQISTNAGEWCQDGCAGFGYDMGSDPPGLDVRNYNTYGVLITQNTNGNFGECPYINGTPATGNCNAGQYDNGASDTSITAVDQLILYTGAQRPDQQCGAGAGNCQTPTGNVDDYYQRITVWTCPSWQTTTNGCAGSVISTPP